MRQDQLTGRPTVVDRGRTAAIAMREEPVHTLCDGLVAAMRARTSDLHTLAERSGIVREVLRGTASRQEYALLLRTLLPSYQALEAGLERHRQSPLMADLACPELYRAAAIEADLSVLVEPDWAERLPLLAAGRDYANCVAAASAGDGARLLAHAYTRFLGDLSGGRVMAVRLAASLGPLSGALRFHAFPGIANVNAFKAAYLAALDRAGTLVSEVSLVVDEAAVAFTCNIAVSNAVQVHGRAPEVVG